MNRLKVTRNEEVEGGGGGGWALIIQAAGERAAGGAWLGRSWGKVGFDKDFVRGTEIASRRSHNSLWADEDFLLAGDGLANVGFTDKRGHGDRGAQGSGLRRRERFGLRWGGRGNS